MVGAFLIRFACLIRASLIEPDIAERTRGLLLSISRDSVRASLTAAIKLPLVDGRTSSV